MATGVTLYALYLVLVVILGRTGRTEFNFPATIAALAPTSPSTWCWCRSLGIVGAGLALVASYLVVLALMYVFTQRLFPVPYEWRAWPWWSLSPRRWSAPANCCCPPPAPPACSAAPVLLLAYPLALFAIGFLTPGSASAGPPTPPGDRSAALPAPARPSRLRRTAASPRSTRPSARTRTPALGVDGPVAGIGDKLGP